MARLQAKYVPIGSKMTDIKPDEPTLTMKEKEANAKVQRVKTPTLGSNKEQIIMPLGKKNVVDEPSNEDVFAEEFNKLEDDFLLALSEMEEAVDDDIKCGKIILPSQASNVGIALKLTEQFEEMSQSVISDIEYKVEDKKIPEYSKEIVKAAGKLEKLEKSMDYVNYQNELRLQELEHKKLRVNRYRKRKLDGTEDLGISESEVDSDKSILDEIGIGSRKKNVSGYREAFKQDYVGSDLEGIDDVRDKLESEIQNRKERKKSGLFGSSKTEEEKIEEAKERLRKKQEKRKKRNAKKQQTDDSVAEIDLIGNQFDVEELQEERMDRLIEIKRISAEKKDLQKKKEEQRSKATKEFYKYKKVNKKSHIVGFKQR